MFYRIYIHVARLQTMMELKYFSRPDTKRSEYNSWKYARQHFGRIWDWISQETEEVERRKNHSVLIGFSSYLLVLSF